jgi:hypothetical protein
LFFKGIIDQVQIFNRALASPAEAGSNAPVVRLPAGLVHLYNGDGDTSDATGGTAGAIQGTVGFAPGQFGQAFNFTGAGKVQYAPLDLDTHDFTVNFVVKTTGTGDQTVLGNRLVNAHGNFFNVRIINGNVAAEVDQDSAGTNYIVVFSHAVVNDNKFHSVSVVRAGTTLSVYIDGVLDNSATSTTGVANLNSSQNFYLGGTTASGLPGLVGLLEGVQVFDRAINPAFDTGANALERGLPRGLVHEWTGNGDASDAAGGATGVTQGVTFVNGQSGQAFSFAGAGSVRYAPPAFGTSDFTVSFVLQTTVSGPQAVLGDRVTSGAGNFFGVRMAQGKLIVELCQDTSGTNYVGITSSRTVNDGAFHQIAIVRSGTSLKLFIDGVLDTSATSAGVTNQSAAQNFLLGAENPASYPNYNGLLDEVRIYDRALGIDEVQALGGTSAGLLTDETSNPRVANGVVDIGAVEAGAAVGVDIKGQPVDTMAGRVLAPVVVEVVDGTTNLQPFGNQPVTLAILSGPAGARLLGTTTVQAVNGVATFSDLRLPVTGTYVLVTTSGALTPDFSNPFVVQAAPAFGLSVSAPPSTVQAGKVLAPVTVRVVDDQGNTVTDSTALVTIQLGAHPAGATLQGTTTVHAVNGVATFSNLTISTPGSGYTLLATSQGLGKVATNVFTVLAPITGLSLSHASVQERRAPGTLVGSFAATEAGTGHRFTYRLVAGTGSTGNAFFRINGNQLLAAHAFDLAKGSSYSIRVRVTDEHGTYLEQVFTIRVVAAPKPIGRALTVTRTTDSDSLRFAAGTAQDSLMLDEVSRGMDAAAVSDILFQGNCQAHAPKLSPTGGTLSGKGTVNGADGADKGRRYASKGNDSFIGAGQTGSLGDGADSIVISAVEAVWLHAPAGGHNSIHLAHLADLLEEVGTWVSR